MAYDENIRDAWVESVDSEGNFTSQSITTDLVANQGGYSTAHLTAPWRVGVKYVYNETTYVVYYADTECIRFPPYPLDGSDTEIRPQIVRATLNSTVDVTALARQYAGPRYNFYTDAECDGVISDPADLLYPHTPHSLLGTVTLTVHNVFMQKNEFIVFTSDDAKQ